MHTLTYERVQVHASKMLFVVELEQLSSRMGNTIDSATKQAYSTRPKDAIIVFRRTDSKNHTETPYCVPHALLSMPYELCSQVYALYEFGFWCIYFSLLLQCHRCGWCHRCHHQLCAILPCVLCARATFIARFHGTYVHYYQ